MSETAKSKLDASRSWNWLAAATMHAHAGQEELCKFALKMYIARCQEGR